MKFSKHYFKENINLKTTIPAIVLTGSEYNDSGTWSNFKNMSNADQIKWARTVDLTEPIGVHLDTDSILFSDGHHRVKAASVLGKDVPVIITQSRYNERDSLLLIDLLRSGLTLRQINPIRMADRYIDINKVKEYYDKNDTFNVHDDEALDKYYNFIRKSTI